MKNKVVHRRSPCVTHIGGSTGQSVTLKPCIGLQKLYREETKCSSIPLCHLSAETKVRFLWEVFVQTVKTRKDQKSLCGRSLCGRSLSVIMKGPVIIKGLDCVIL